MDQGSIGSCIIMDLDHDHDHCQDHGHDHDQGSLSICHHPIMEFSYRGMKWIMDPLDHGSLWIMIMIKNLDLSGIMEFFWSKLEFNCSSYYIIPNLIPLFPFVDSSDLYQEVERVWGGSPERQHHVRVPVPGVPEGFHPVVQGRRGTGRHWPTDHR